MDLDKLQALIGIFESSNLAEIEIEEEGRRLRLCKKPEPSMHAMPALTGPHYSLQPSHVIVPEPPAAAGAAPPGQSAAATPTKEDEGLVTINAPMVGVFYSAPSPNDPPFVRAGDTVQADQTVCIVEAMKLMNEVAAKFPAVIERVLVENAEPVEFGQPLFSVRPL